MRIIEFASGLRPLDASVGIALLELVKRADQTGALDRGEWLAAVQSSFRKDGGPAAVSNASLDELAPYLKENILGRLQSEGIAGGEPAGDAWERVRVQPAIWQEVAADRGDAILKLEQAVRNLLLEGERRAPTVTEAAPRAVPGGSTLSTRGLVKAYRRRKVVNEVDITVSQGEIVGLLGPNGAGKTTTFYVMVGLISPDAGHVFFDDVELTDMPMYLRARKGIGYLAQEPSVFRKLTVEQNIMAILETMPKSRAERKARLETLLGELGIKHLRKNRAYSLSGGERRRLEITRALVSEPKFMLLDEPFAGVDPIAVHDIQQIVAGEAPRDRRDHYRSQCRADTRYRRSRLHYVRRPRTCFGTVAELVWNEEVAEIYFGPTLTARMRERYERPSEAVELA
jgi:lipopolysaccharide export system ATP-binding protein